MILITKTSDQTRQRGGVCVCVCVCVCMFYESLERVIGINHKYWNHGKIKGTKAPLPLSTSEMAHFVHERLIVPTQDYVLYK